MFIKQKFLYDWHFIRKSSSATAEIDPETEIAAKVSKVIQNVFGDFQQFWEKKTQKTRVQQIDKAISEYEKEYNITLSPDIKQSVHKFISQMFVRRGIVITGPVCSAKT